jgi:ribonuclease P protein component
MLPKNERIQRKNFSQILLENKTYNSPNLLLHITPNPDKNSKFSFSVSKKICPNAVDRNKLRRRGYSIILKNKNIIKSGSFCFFSFKKTKRTPTFATLEKEIVGLLSSAGVII